MIDAGALRAADIVVVDTEEHLARLPKRHQARAVVVPVGVPSAWYEAAVTAEQEGTAAVQDACPAAGGVFRLVHPPAGSSGHRRRAEPDGRGVRRGHHDRQRPGQGRDDGRGRPGDAIRWLDWVPAADLPALVAGHDVCLGIFGAADKALRVVPNKVFQGAAAGCAIVTSDTAPQRRALAGAGVLVPPGDPDALAAALLRLAGDRGELARLRRQARTLAEEQFMPERIVTPLVKESTQPHNRRLRCQLRMPRPQPYDREGTSTR